MNNNKENKNKKNRERYAFIPTLDFNIKPGFTSEPSWSNPIPLTDTTSSATYYPAGQRILEDEGKELNFSNYKDYFGNDIHKYDLNLIDKSEDKKEIKAHKLSKVRKYALLSTGHSIFLKILNTSILVMIFSLPILLYIQIGIQNVDINTIYYYYIILVIIFFLSLIASIVLSEKEIKILKTLDLDELKINEID